MSFYSNELFTTGSIYFETTQTLTCDCTTISCTGTFYLSFDGEMTQKISVASAASAIKTALGNYIFTHLLDHSLIRLFVPVRWSHYYRFGWSNHHNFHR